MLLRYKLVLLLFCSLITLNLLKCDKIDEAFVAYATPSYFPILKILLDSLKIFSKKPVIVYGVNSDIPFSIDEYPLLIPRRIDVDLTRYFVWCYKAHIMFESNVRYGIYIDADSVIASPQIDLLFDLCRFADPYPLSPIHPDNVRDDRMNKLMHAMDVHEQSMHYLHDNIILFSAKCSEFLQEWYLQGLRCACITMEDEKILNTLLWKHNWTRYIEPIEFYWDKIDVISKNRIGDYTDLLKLCARKNFMNADFYDHHVKYPLIFHGCKNPEVAALLLNYIKQRTN